MKPAKEVVYLNDVKKDTLYGSNVANKPDFMQPVNFVMLALKPVRQKNKRIVIGPFNRFHFI